MIQQAAFDSMKFTSNRFRSPGLLAVLDKGLFRLACQGILAVFSLAMAARGHSIFWDGTGGTSWATVGSWSLGAGIMTDPAAVPGVADAVNFSVSSITNTAQTVNLNSSRSALRLVFLGTNTATTTLLGGGNNQALTPAGNGISVNSLAGAVTLGSATDGQQLTLSAGQSWANDSANTLTVASSWKTRCPCQRSALPSARWIGPPLPRGVTDNPSHVTISLGRVQTQFESRVGVFL